MGEHLGISRQSSAAVAGCSITSFTKVDEHGSTGDFLVNFYK
jgi:hypothetical protein